MNLSKCDVTSELLKKAQELKLSQPQIAGLLAALRNDAHLRTENQDNDDGSLFSCEAEREAIAHASWGG